MNNFKENNIPARKSDEAKTKNAWHTPKIIDLDVEGTEKTGFTFDGTNFSPPSS